MKKITPEIFVQNCKEALDYYKETFGGEIKNVQIADEKKGFKGHEGKIIHAELHINKDCVLYLVDLFDKAQGNNITLVLELDSEEEIKRLYAILSEEGSIEHELQKAFWGAYHAVIEDKYGVSWALNYTIK